MPIKCFVQPFQFYLSSIWVTKKEFLKMDPDQIRNLIKEDLLSFLDEIPNEGLLGHCEFYWREK